MRGTNHQHPELQKRIKCSTANDEVGECIHNFTTRANTPTLGSQVRQQDNTLLVHWLFRYEVSHLKQAHGSRPRRQSNQRERRVRPTAYQTG